MYQPLYKPTARYMANCVIRCTYTGVVTTLGKVGICQIKIHPKIQYARHWTYI